MDEWTHINNRWAPGRFYDRADPTDYLSLQHESTGKDSFESRNQQGCQYRNQVFVRLWHKSRISMPAL